MCDKCKNLLNLPNDKKAWTHLFNYKEDELNDANHFKMIMEVNHDEETKKLLYVAISRARCEVILIVNIETLSRKQASHFKKELNEYF